MTELAITPIATVHSPYKQKFAIPRQPRLIDSAIGEIHLEGEFSHPDFVRGLDEFTHIWLIFSFHQTREKGYSALVRPPRLGGNAKKGVFATRATFRPNGLGMSAVKLERIDIINGKAVLVVRGLDLLDGTPIIDIKPYLPYSDALNDASAGFADTRPETDIEVAFSEEANAQLKTERQTYPELENFISQVLKQDPRPAYKKKRGGVQEYGMNLYHYNIKWQIEGSQALVVEITALDG